MPHKKGFTLVELLVVIAIVALLVAILLPALGKARNLARLAKSMSNNRQILVGMNAYRADHKNRLPLIISNQGGGVGWATWTYGGKFCDARWAGVNAGLFDQHPLRRPVNFYLNPNFACDPDMSATARRSVDVPVFQSPGDKASYQFLSPYPRPDFTRSSYDDVGTSYHNNMKWWDHMLAAHPRRSGETTLQHWNRVLLIGMKRMDMANGFTATKYIWIHDQTGDIVAHDPQRRSWNGEFGDRNKSVCSFLDGHTDYISIVPGMTTGPGYTFEFLHNNQ